MPAKTERIPTYLHRRNHTFYYRKRVPRYLSKYFDVTELRFSLSVASVISAKRKADMIEHRTEQLFTFLDLITKFHGDNENSNGRSMSDLTEQRIRQLAIIPINGWISVISFLSRHYK